MTPPRTSIAVHIAAVWTIALVTQACALTGEEDEESAARCVNDPSAVELTLGQPVTATLAENTSACYTFTPAAERGHQVIISQSTDVFGAVDVHDDAGNWVIANGFCCGTENTQAYFVPNDPEIPAYGVEVETRDFEGAPTGDLGYTLVVEETGTGTTPFDPVFYDNNAAAFSSNGTLDAVESRYYTFNATVTGAYTIDASGMYWSDPSAAENWVLFTNPGNVAGSTVASCAASFNGSENRNEAICGVSLTAGQTYYVEMTEAAGVPLTQSSSMFAWSVFNTP